MADHAFPELHSRGKAKAKNKEPENLLILTRTRTDKHGRRHSVAVPLIPPPDGERFEGGYHVERNPITGGATLVPPPSGKLQLSIYLNNLFYRYHMLLNKIILPGYEATCSQLKNLRQIVRETQIFHSNS